MLGKLFSKAGSSARKPTETVVTPDISRIMKSMAPSPPPPEEQLQVATFEAVSDEMPESMATQFDAWMRRDLEALRATWADVQQAGASADDYRRLYTAAHNITGAAPSYGFPAVSRLSQSLCLLLSRTGPGENGPLINLHVEACRAAIAAGAQGEASHSVADAVCDALERRVNAKLAAAG
jgi:hypothetical protein